ncbi:hypothetical protein CV684_05675 [Borreliella burgdorferi]|uniref:hypothetical protein n=2 Tax=Borreliella burgdorferi TaxID=139 RepID=UPI00017F3620|nr:hypothetical protein [Borreliella burgdorferi]ACN55418.1 Bbs27 protein [Borreliella burgdorferi WI91-23]PRQ94683.1 hypothetical protein CV684_05675 [Borreliella burgdorferi]PRR24365.1 hypothetical protein CV641_05480 [Borreliella burgdorferi]PRR49499.1 hypothetical protein CV652_06310 [Borreliella burgdorferi]
MQKINLLMLFMFIISIGNLISYEIKKDEIIKVKTLIVGYKGPGESESNFSVKKEDKNKSPLELLGIGLENFINQIGAENILEIKSLSHLVGFGVIVVYKEKKK